MKTLKGVLASAANYVLRSVGAEVVRYEQYSSWDEIFMECIRRSKRENRDPNEILEEIWEGAASWLRSYVYPHFEDRYIVCEIGPGSGRFSRHIVDRCDTLYLVDNSLFVCNFLEKYFGNHPNVEVIHCTNCDLPQIPSESVDLVFSFGTFVHLDVEQFYGYLLEASRILRRDGFAVINYANIMSSGGYGFFKEALPPGFSRSVFRFHHPEKIRKIAGEMGFEVFKETPEETQGNFIIELRKP